MRSIYDHNSDISHVRNSCSEEEYSNKRKIIKQSLTSPSVQFKRQRIEKKVDNLKERYSNNPAPNRFKRREGYTLTPLMQGKIQYGKMKKKDNIDAVREELKVRLVNFDSNAGWKEMIKLLREHENKTNEDAHEKYFRPLTAYTNFTWNKEN